MKVTQEECQLHMVRVPVNQYLNLSILEVEEGYCLVKMPYNPVFANSWNNTHGGALMTLADIAFYFALATLNGLQASGDFATAELKSNFLKPTSKTDLYAEARVIKNGKRIIFGDVAIRDISGIRISHATVSYIRTHV